MDLIMWLQDNLDIIFFIYGLAFIVMGLAILIQPKKGSVFKIAGNLWLLAGFGLTHGVNEWLDMWAMIKGRSETLDLVRWFCLVISYMFIFEFGLRLLKIKISGSSQWGEKLTRYLSLPILLVIFTLGFTSNDFWKTGSIWTRYLLCFPGTLLTFSGLLYYYQNERGILEPLKVKMYFLWAGLSFMAYGILGGLVVPKGDFFPSNILNTDSFLLTTHIPVQFFRAIIAIIAAWAIVRMLKIFNWETGKKLQDAVDEWANTFDSISDYVSVHDKNCKIIKTNKALADFLKMKPEDVIGKYCYEVFHNTKEPWPDCPYPRMLESKGPVTEEIDNPNLGCILEITSSPIFDDNGEVMASVHYTKDITERKLAEEEIRQNCNIQTVLNSILSLSLKDIPLKELLKRTLDLMLSIPWFTADSKGCIFVVEDEPGVLVMKAQKGLPEPIQKECARLPFGRCFCGRAASTHEIQFADYLDNRHEVNYEGIVLPAHYCVPIVSDSTILGVINLHLREGHQANEKEENFLTAVANTLAGVIKRKQAEENLKEAVTTDRVTKRLNRLSFEKDKKNLKNPVLLLINIDSFRHINDFYGIPAGDFILGKLVKYLSHIIPGDLGATIYRLGADDFGILFEDTPKYRPEDLARMIIDGIEREKFSYQDYDISISLSIGISREKPLLEKADMVLKHVKRDPRRKYLEYREELHLYKNISKNLRMVNIIKDAIGRDAVVIYYQPIIDNRTEKIVMYESLARIIDKESNVLPPASFLQIAKEAKLYAGITAIMIRKSILAHKDSEHEFSINLSIEDILDEAVSEFITTMLDSYPEVASRVTLEFLESEGIENYQAVYDFIRELREYGCKVSIDDFGTGYSNFNHILKLDADYIKIADSLVKDIEKNKNSQTMVKTMVNFAKELKIKTVAEYVHSREVYEKVKDLGVDYSQGYYFGKPNPTIV